MTGPDSAKATIFQDVTALLGHLLQLGPRTGSLTRDTPLLGALPELDSMSVVAVLTALEEHYGFVIEDDDISADTFTDVGSLVTFVERKLRH